MVITVINMGYTIYRTNLRILIKFVEYVLNMKSKFRSWLCRIESCSIGTLLCVIPIY